MSISNDETAIEFVRTRIRIRAELIDVHEHVLDTYDVPHSFLMDMYHTDLQDLRRRIQHAFFAEIQIHFHTGAKPAFVSITDAHDETHTNLLMHPELYAQRMRSIQLLDVILIVDDPNRNRIQALHDLYYMIL